MVHHRIEDDFLRAVCLGICGTALLVFAAALLVATVALVLSLLL